MISFEDFAEKFIVVQEGITRDFLHQKPVTPCKILHQEVQMTQTKDPRADEVAERLSEQGGFVDPESIDFTEEHVKLHELLRGVQMESQMAGLGADQQLAIMFVIGRRYGMREASEMFNSLSETPQA